MLSLCFFSCHSQNFHIKPQFDAVMPFKNGIAAVKQNELWGIIDTAGNWVFKPMFIIANTSVNNEYIVEENNVECIQVLRKDHNAKWILSPFYFNDEEYQTSLGLRKIDIVNNKFVIRNANDVILTDSMYDVISYIGNDLFIGNDMYKGDQIIHASGKTVTPFYSEISKEVIFGRLKFKQGDYSGVIATDGKVIVKPTWWLLELAGKNIACTIGGDLNLHNEKLELLSEFNFNTVQNFENGNWLARNTHTAESILFNSDGAILLDSLEFGHGGLSKGLLAAGNTNKYWGYVNALGDEVITFKYEYSEAFMSSGYAVVWKKVNGIIQKYLIDTTGKQIETAPFNSIDWHFDGIYYLTYEDKNQLLDKDFKPMTELTKTPIAYIGSSVYIEYKVSKSLAIQKGNFYTSDKAKLFWSKDVELSSMYSIDGNLLVDKKEYEPMDLIPSVSEGFASIKRNGKWGFIKCGKFY